MAVEDHPLYAEWSAAFDKAVQADLRYYRAAMASAGAKTFPRSAAAEDCRRAWAAYHEVCARLDEQIEKDMGDR